MHLLSIANILNDSKNSKIENVTLLLEELENCLHPRIQRNIYDYIYRNFAGSCRIFLTTHSSTCLDYFQGMDDVSLTHVYQVKGKTRTRPVQAFNDRCHTLDALGSKASDILQTNAAIWVKGPSDRIYLKHLFDLCNSKLSEGRDYSIMFYGGKLLSHLSLDDESDNDEFIRLLKINRNSAIIIDSDKKVDHAKINATKTRICAEADIYDMCYWVTEGKEIENYVSPTFFENHFELAEGQIKKFSNPWDLIEKKKAKNGQIIHSKVELAEYVRENAKADDFQLDWQAKVMELIAFINKANDRVFI